MTIMSSSNFHRQTQLFNSLHYSAHMGRFRADSGLYRFANLITNLALLLLEFGLPVMPRTSSIETALEYKMALSCLTPCVPRTGLAWILWYLQTHVPSLPALQLPVVVEPRGSHVRNNRIVFVLARWRSIITIALIFLGMGASLSELVDRAGGGRASCSAAHSTNGTRIRGMRGKMSRAEAERKYAFVGFI